MRSMKVGFVLAGLYNSGIGIFSRGFGDTLAAVDPLFTGKECVAIQLWGLAYLALWNRHDVVPALSAVFCLEKLFYGVHWVLWIRTHGGELPDMVAQDPMTGFFFSIYGAGDLAFMVFFACAAWRWRENLFTPKTPAPA